MLVLSDMAQCCSGKKEGADLSLPLCSFAQPSFNATVAFSFLMAAPGTPTLRVATYVLSGLYQEYKKTYCKKTDCGVAIFICCLAVLNVDLSCCVLYCLSVHEA